MKNIHILPTDKPTMLFKDDFGNFIYSINIDQEQNHFEPQHIYITSDEEIKEGEICIYGKSLFLVENIFYNSGAFRHLSPKIKIKGKLLPNMKAGEFDSMTPLNKIILTTDQDLIKDGVQAIDDEFLEWFVKNPSCEKVEVKRNKKLSNKSIWDAVEGDLVFNNHNCGGVITQLSNDIRVHIISENGEGYMETAITSDNGLDTLVINNYKVYEYSDYKIIIPKEELEQETVGRQFHKTADTVISVVRNKETLEERGPYWELVDKKAEKNNTIDLDAYANGIRDGAKWQAERMYSEEDLKRAFEAGHKKGFSGYPNTENWKELPFEKWFEQIKKK